MTDAADKPLAPADLMAELADLDDFHALRARYDAAACASYILRDEGTNQPIVMQPMHFEWHRLADRHQRLLVWAHIEGGKTHQISIARSLWELGRNPKLRICIVSNTDRQAQKICMTIGKYIEESPEYRKVFPGVTRAPNLPWTRHMLYVSRGGVASKDPSVRSCGVHSSILGARIDLLIIDDLLDYENTLTKHARDDLFDWYTSTLETRLTRKSRVFCIGTAWHRDDIMHRFARKKNWLAVRYPVVDEDGNLSWPANWPLERIEEKRQALGPIESNRAMLCIARSDEESRFKKEWIDKCLARGDGHALTYALQAVPDGYATHTGVDLGVRVKAGSDLSALFTIIVHPNGDRELLDLDAGRWTGPQIVKKIVDVHHRYHSIVTVENVAAQEFVVQFIRDGTDVPVRSFTTTGQNVRHPQFGLESLATEMANEKWIIPNKNGDCHPQVRAWIDEMLYYDPLGHPGDRLMASWFAREGSRLTRPKAKIGTIDLLSR